MSGSNLFNELKQFEESFIITDGIFHMKVNFYGLRVLKADNGFDIHNNNYFFIQPHPYTLKARMVNNDYYEKV